MLMPAQSVAVVIPAYNEDQTIAGVLVPTIGHPLVDEVIVVSDGSEDMTALTASRLGARVVELSENVGKGAAMLAGIAETEADVVLFLDADLIGLRPEHIEGLLLPVLHGNYDMVVGVFEGGRAATDFAQAIAPFLSGQRAVRRSVLLALGEMDELGYGAEIALTRFMKRHRNRVAEVVLRDLTHVMKEEKRGFIKGFAARMKMYWDIVKVLPKD